MQKTWKYYLGICLLCYSFVPFIVAAALPFLGFSLTQSGTFAVIFLATGEVAFLSGAALLGKKFVQDIKSRILKLFKRPQAEPKPVSLARHRMGVTLLAVSFLPYYTVLVELFFCSPSGDNLKWSAWALATGELIFIIALILLGSQFWDKLKHLFDWPGNDPGGKS